MEFQDLAACLEDLNKTLDELLLEFFEKLETLEGLRNGLTNAMKHGFLSMSKARYSMGNKAVGEMQYARNMIASTLVLEEDNCSNSEDDQETLKPDLSCSEVVFDGGKRKKESCKGLEDLEGNQKSGLRQRTAGKNNQEEDLGEQNETGSSSKEKSTDPLKWFGVLVPTSLRDCQKEFKTACRFSFEIVQLEQEVNTIIDDYLDLKEKKKIIQDSDESRKLN